MILGDSTYVHPILDKISDQAEHQPYSVTLLPHVEVWEKCKDPQKSIQKKSSASYEKCISLDLFSEAWQQSIAFQGSPIVLKKDRWYNIGGQLVCNFFRRMGHRPMIQSMKLCMVDHRL